MRQKAFTLLEILVVVAILAILIAIGLYIGTAPSTASPTKVHLSTLKEIMLDYESRNAPLTNAANPDPTRIWLTVLRAYPKTASLLAPLKLSPDKTQILDAFGNPIRFIPADTSPDHRFHFQSAGPDAQFNTPDDLYSP